MAISGVSLRRMVQDWLAPDPRRGFRVSHYGRYGTLCFAHEYFAGGLTLPGALKATAILFDRKDALHDVFFRSHFGVTVGRYPRHYFPSPVALLNAILDDLGYGLVHAVPLADTPSVAAAGEAPTVRRPS